MYVFGFDETQAKYVATGNFQAHDTYITRLAYSPDGQLLATCSADHTACLWSAKARSPSSYSPAATPASSPAPLFSRHAFLRGHAKWVWDCAFSADSAYLLTASSDATARLWETSGGQAVSVYTGHGKAVTSIALNDIP